MRASFGGRPFPSGRRFDRRIGSNKAHCSSLSSQRPCMGLVSRQIARSSSVSLNLFSSQASFFSSRCQRTIFETSSSHLLDHRPNVDRVIRKRLVDRVITRWEAWHSQKGGETEEYLAELSRTNQRELHDAVWFVGLAVALRMGQLQTVGANLEVIKHNLDRTSVHELEEFWNILFRARANVSVTTTNFDVLAERGLRTVPRPKVPRPGFHYGFGPEDLQGGGYPSYSHIHKIGTTGHVPLLKLHGSVSWSVRNGELVKYHDCRPAIRGDAAIVAPIVEKTIPEYLRPTWEAAKNHLGRARTWIVVGYSLPHYDQAVRALLLEATSPDTTIHIFDPDSAVASRFRDLTFNVRLHPGLPDGIDELNDMLKQQ